MSHNDAHPYVAVNIFKKEREKKSCTLTTMVNMIWGHPDVRKNYILVSKFFQVKVWNLVLFRK